MDCTFTTVAGAFLIGMIGGMSLTGVGLYALSILIESRNDLGSLEGPDNER